MRNWIRFATIPVFAAALSLAACAEQEGPNALTGVGSADFARTGSGQPAAGEIAANPRVSGTSANGTVQSWQIGVGTLPDPTDLTGEATIGREGGYVFTQGHVLVVPEGAVSEPTRFTIRAASAASTGAAPVMVELHAYRYTWSGRTIDVGVRGFNKPVQLAMSYAWARQTYSRGLADATILWVKGPGVAEEVPTHRINRGGRWIVADLAHFSAYALAWPD